MGKTALTTAELRASLAELREAGSPVDVSVAAQISEREKVEIEQQGGIHDSMVLELEDGRVAVMADILVTNRTSRTINGIDIELEAPWGEKCWEWLMPTRKCVGRGKQSFSFQLYKFPGKGGWEFGSDDVINHRLIEVGKLPSGRPLSGWLMGIGGRMPAELCHGQWQDFSLAIFGPNHTEYRETIRLWTDRPKVLPKAVAPGMSVLGQTFNPIRDRP